MSDPKCTCSRCVGSRTDSTLANLKARIEYVEKIADEKQEFMQSEIDRLKLEIAKLKECNEALQITNMVAVGTRDDLMKRIAPLQEVVAAARQAVRELCNDSEPCAYSWRVCEKNPENCYGIGPLKAALEAYDKELRR